MVAFGVVAVDIEVVVAVVVVEIGIQFVVFAVVAVAVAIAVDVLVVVAAAAVAVVAIAVAAVAAVGVGAAVMAAIGMQFDSLLDRSDDRPQWQHRNHYSRPVHIVAVNSDALSCHYQHVQFQLHESIPLQNVKR